MGMEEFGGFDPKKKIIEFAIDSSERPLVSMTLTGFADELASDSPAPGGGSVAALAGALGAGLAAMVPNLSVGKRKFSDAKDELNEAAIEAQELKDSLLIAVDDDTAAFNRWMEALRLPKGTEEEAEARKSAIGDAIRVATVVPFTTLKRAVRVLHLADVSVKKGNPNALSDAGVAAHMALSSAEGAYLNVLINLKEIEDTKFRRETYVEAEELIEKAREKASEIRIYVEEKLKSELES